MRSARLAVRSRFGLGLGLGLGLATVLALLGCGDDGAGFLPYAYPNPADDAGDARADGGGEGG